MSATINQQPAAPATASERLELIQKVEGQVARITAIRILTQEEGFLTIGEDKTLRIILKRDNGYWPSAIEYFANVPTSLYYDEESSSAFVGLVTGAVYHCTTSDDLNKIEVTRRWDAHTNAVTGVANVRGDGRVLSCSRDRTLAWHAADTGARLGRHTCDAACTVLTFDATTNFAFVGDHSGSISVLRVEGSDAQLISKLSAHSSPICDLAYEASKQLLYSASTSLLVMFDIGAKKGECYELTGHEGKISSVTLARRSTKLLSVDDSGHLVCWDMKAKRITTPAWKETDRCNKCDAPFFWNISVMWSRRVVGVRRHHCRTCGVSVCGNCCNNWTTFPAMGFEKRVRVCGDCAKKMEAMPERTPLATQRDLRHSVVDMQLDEANRRLVTVGYDRAIMVWNVATLLQ